MSLFLCRDSAVENLALVVAATVVEHCGLVGRASIAWIVHIGRHSIYQCIIY